MARLILPFILALTACPPTTTTTTTTDVMSDSETGSTTSTSSTGTADPDAYTSAPMPGSTYGPVPTTSMDSTTGVVDECPVGMPCNSAQDCGDHLTCMYGEHLGAEPKPGVPGVCVEQCGDFPGWPGAVDLCEDGAYCAPPPPDIGLAPGVCHTTGPDSPLTAECLSDDGTQSAPV